MVIRVRNVAEPAALPPPFTQQQLLRLYAAKVGTLNDNGTVQTQRTAKALRLGPEGTQKVQRWQKGSGIIHWDDAWRIYVALGWIRESRVKLEAAQAAAQESRETARQARARRGRSPRGETGT